MKTLVDSLEEYYEADIYPMHMPGHKRYSLPDESDVFSRLKHYDITEIDGFDDLHDAQGIIKQIEDKAQKLYRADECHLLINGSSAGILSAISAVAKKGKKLLMCRNAHKSAYNALLLNDIWVDYIYAKQFTNYGIYADIQPLDIENALKNGNAKDYCAIYITSPTYEGIVSDIRSIADIAHRYNLPLIVDAAHGAHFGLSKVFKELVSPIADGADVLIMSMHKTLNAPTQTALLAVQGDLIDIDKLRDYLRIYQSSSPSYIFMGMMEQCIDQLLVDADALFDNYKSLLDDFYKASKRLKYLKLFIDTDEYKNCPPYGYDTGKIVITLPVDFTIKGIEDGYALSRLLLEKYRIQTEMSSLNYIICMTSYMDRDEGYRRLINACLDIENGAWIEKKKPGEVYKVCRPIQKMSIHEAYNLPYEMLKYDRADGRISGGFIYAYPPGIPIVCPGEVINGEIIKTIDQYRICGIGLKGIDTRYSIRVLK